MSDAAKICSDPLCGLSGPGGGNARYCRACKAAMKKKAKGVDQMEPKVLEPANLWSTDIGPSGSRGSGTTPQDNCDTDENRRHNGNSKGDKKESKIEGRDDNDLGDPLENSSSRNSRLRSTADVKGTGTGSKY